MVVNDGRRKDENMRHRAATVYNVRSCRRQKGDRLKVGILEKDYVNYRLVAMMHWQIGAAAGDWKSAANLIYGFGLHVGMNPPSQ